MQDKIKELKKFLKRSEKEDPAALKEEAKDFLRKVDANELIMAEQEMIDEGLDPAELSHLCAAHLEVMSDDLEKMKAKIPENHPLSVLVAEHDEILKFLSELEQLGVVIGRVKRKEELPKRLFGQLQHLAHHLEAAEKHHQREEDVLFPEMEKLGVYGPPQIMAMEHIVFRKMKKELAVLAENEEIGDLAEFKKKFAEVSSKLVQNLRDHIFKENNILYPAALEVVPKALWKKIGENADKIGYCCFTPKHLLK